MLRDPALIPLSRQHHDGLALCILARRELAQNAPVATVARNVIATYDLELANHFEIEEQVLFPLCGPAPLIEELLAEHRVLQNLIAQLRTAPSAEILEEFFTLLTAHIRREERELFEQIQRDLSREALDQAGCEIERRVVRVCIAP